jgi:hypothetical protein
MEIDASTTLTELYARFYSQRCTSMTAPLPPGYVRPPEPENWIVLLRDIIVDNRVLYNYIIPPGLNTVYSFLMEKTGRIAYDKIRLRPTGGETADLTGILDYLDTILEKEIRAQPALEITVSSQNDYYTIRLQSPHFGAIGNNLQVQKFRPPVYHDTVRSIEGFGAMTAVVKRNIVADILGALLQPDDRVSVSGYTSPRHFLFTGSTTRFTGERKAAVEIVSRRARGAAASGAVNADDAELAALLHRLAKPSKNARIKSFEMGSVALFLDRGEMTPLQKELKHLMQQACPRR